MQRITKRLMAAVLCAAVTLSCFPNWIPNAAAAMPDYENTYVNTGNQRQDILGVALTQLGYTEIGDNDTKYGTWYGLPYNPWCAMFVTWCARQADIPTDVLKRSAKADPRSGYFGISCFYSNQRMPQPGDLFFTTKNTHVGLVYYVEGDHFYTIEGNSNANQSTEGFCVISNRRTLSGYKFASPAYKGGDKDHNYVLKEESSHPHRTYYQCSDCNATHYTGNSKCIKDCPQCFSCGCSSKAAGYYLCQVPDKVASVRPGHTSTVTDKTRLGYIGDGMVVYVHGMANGYACIEYDNLRGHVLSKYLKPYHPAPEAPSVSVENGIYAVGDTVSISWNAPANTEEYRVVLLRDGQEISNSKTTDKQYKLQKAEVGEYEVRIYAGNRTGASEAGTTAFSVRNLYSITYNPNNGTGAPETQKQISGLEVTVSKQIPTRDGRDFLGWTATKGSPFAEIQPGDTITADQNITLYAVWKKKSAAVSELTIQTPPLRSKFLIGDELNTEGLLLKVLYSDGKGCYTSSGFTATGFAADELCDKTVTLEYGGLTVDYKVQIVTHIPGDTNDDRLVNSLDGLMLLRYLNGWDITIARPETADVNVDKEINSLDGLILLRHLNGWDITLK